MRHYLAALPWAAAICSIASLVEAHISLDLPVSRYFQTSSNEADQTKLKVGPCGVSGDKRTTTASLITPFKPGETITVTWRETVQHPGHFRIAFDSDGQDFTMPGEATPSGVVILADNIPDKSTANYSQQVTLPSIECANCTLQLIQVMTTNPPPYAATGDLYFNCADIILKAAGGATGAGGKNTGGGGMNTGAGGATNTQGGRATAAGGSSARASTVTGGVPAVATTSGTTVVGGMPGSGGTSIGDTIGVGGFSTSVSSSGKGGNSATGGKSASSIGGTGIGGAVADGGSVAASGGNGFQTTSAAGALGASTATSNDSGCGCRIVSGPSPWSPIGLGVVGLFMARRRRRRSDLG